MNKLLPLGWSPEFASLVTAEELPHVARIAMTGQNTFQGITPSGTCYLKLNGKLSYDITEKFDLPAVGDWVVTDPNQQIIQRIIPRHSTFVRNMAGNQDQRQVIAANINEIWLVMSLNHDLNLPRLNRYILSAWDSGAMPLIILTKTDLIADYTDIMQQIKTEHPGVDILCCSSLTGDGITTLKARLKDYRTIALVGSSGVGKSTLINLLAENNLQETASIRENDSRGRHTTTSRNLISVGEAWLIDTPGMREFGIWSTEAQLAHTFDDLVQLAEKCRFNDCHHKTEPGCAITSAIKNGKLPLKRLQEYEKLQRELAYLEKRTYQQALKKNKRRSQ